MLWFLIVDIYALECCKMDVFGKGLGEGLGKGDRRRTRAKAMSWLSASKNAVPEDDAKLLGPKNEKPHGLL